MNEYNHTRKLQKQHDTDIGRCIGAVFSGLVGWFVLGLFDPVFALPGGLVVTAFAYALIQARQQHSRD